MERKYVLACYDIRQFCRYHVDGYRAEGVQQVNGNLVNLEICGVQACEREKN